MFRVISTKEMLYRGLPEQWANTWLFDGSPPADPAAWDAFFTALWNIEKTWLTNDNWIAKQYGYANPDGFLTRGKTYDTGGSKSYGTLVNGAPAQSLSGDVAVCVRFRAGITSKGKPRYIMKYVHPVRDNPGDPVGTTLKDALTTGMGKVRDGTLPGGAKLCTPDGTLAGVPEVLTYKTTRTLKRRGRRPPRP